jgi:hypothetical protein
MTLATKRRGARSASRHNTVEGVLRHHSHRCIARNLAHRDALATGDLQAGADRDGPALPGKCAG